MSLRIFALTALCCSTMLAEDAPKQFSQRHPRYHLQPSDVIEVQYRYTPEYNSTVTVQPDGYVSLQLVGDVYVGGQTLEEASAEIKKTASTRLRDPEVNIALKDFVKPHITVAGEVAKPGSYDLRGDMTTMQAIAISGGFKESAKHSQVMLIRKVDNEWAEVKVLDLKKMMLTGQVGEDVSLRPDDILVVPQNTVSRMERYIRWAGLSLYGIALARP